MLNIARQRWRSRLGLILFLAGQAFSTAHACEHGPDPHEHEGVPCLAILGFENDDLVPAADLAAPTFGASAEQVVETARPVILARPRAFKPPATGPPSI